MDYETIHGLLPCFMAYTIMVIEQYYAGAAELGGKIVNMK